MIKNKNGRSSKDVPAIKTESIGAPPIIKPVHDHSINLPLKHGSTMAPTKQTTEVTFKELRDLIMLANHSIREGHLQAEQTLLKYTKILGENLKQLEDKTEVHLIDISVNYSTHNIYAADELIDYESFSYGYTVEFTVNDCNRHKITIPTISKLSVKEIKQYIIDKLRAE